MEGNLKMPECPDDSEFENFHHQFIENLSQNATEIVRFVECLRN